MPRDIEELADTAQLLRVTWRKAFNFHNSFVRTYLETKALLATGAFGPQWTSEKWLFLKAGLSEPQIVKMALVYAKALSDDDNATLIEIAADADRRKRAAQEIAAADKREAARLKREAKIAALAEMARLRELEQEAREQEEAAKQMIEDARLIEQQQAAKLDKRKKQRKNETPEAIKGARMILDKGKTYAEAQRATGMSSTVLRSAVARLEGLRRAKIKPVPVTPSQAAE